MSYRMVGEQIIYLFDSGRWLCCSKLFGGMRYMLVVMLALWQCWSFVHLQVVAEDNTRCSIL